MKIADLAPSCRSNLFVPEQCGGAAVFHLENRMEEVDGRSKNNQQLYLAAEYGRLDTLRIILKKTKVEITDAITINGNTALHVAVANNTFLEDMLELLPYNKALMGVRNSDGSTLLHVAATYGNTNAAKILVCRSPELLSAKDNEGCTPLDIVLSKPWHTETCLFLWNSALPDIELLDSRFDHLVKAISHEYFELAKSYIQSYSSLKSAAVLMAIAQHCPTDFRPHQIYLYELWSTPIWHFVNRDSLAIDMDHGFLKLANLVLRAGRDTIQDDCTSDHSYLPFTDAILELVDLVRDSNSGNKYQDSVPSFEGFIYYTAALRWYSGQSLSI